MSEITFSFQDRKIPILDLGKDKWSFTTGRGNTVKALPTGVRVEGNSLKFPSHVNKRLSGKTFSFSTAKEATDGRTPDSKIFVDVYKTIAREDMIRQATARLKRKNAARRPDVRGKRVDVDIDRVIYASDRDVADEVRNMTRYNANSFRR
jgi:hypothetical protein